MGENTIASFAKRLFLLRRSVIVPSTKATPSTKRPAIEKTVITAGLFWRKDTGVAARVGVEVGDWEAGAAKIEVNVAAASSEVAVTTGTELEGSVVEAVEDVTGTEEGTEELVTGELVGEGRVVVTLLGIRVG